MKRSEAIAILSTVRAIVEPFGAVAFVGSSLTLDNVPVAFVNPSNAIVVHGTPALPAATFSREGSERAIASLILSRFAARRAA